MPCKPQLAKLPAQQSQLPTGYPRHQEPWRQERRSQIGPRHFVRQPLPPPPPPPPPPPRRLRRCVHPGASPAIHASSLPFVVVGAKGRVGRALVRLAEQNGSPCVALGRGDSLAAALDGAPVGPILIATTNDALEQVVAACPPARRPDLVCLQNGMLLPLLEGCGLQGCTQALLYLSAAADGTLTDGQRTVVCGRWAPEVAELLAAGGVRCRQVAQGEFLALMIEKLLWASIYWLLSAGLGGLPVGAVARHHAGAVAELAGELLPLARAHVAAAGARLQLGRLEEVEALTVEGVCRSMADYSLSIASAVPSRDMALAEFRWRNGWLLAQARTPAHVAWLHRAGVDAA